MRKIYAIVFVIFLIGCGSQYDLTQDQELAEKFRELDNVEKESRDYWDIVNEIVYFIAKERSEKECEALKSISQEHRDYCIIDVAKFSNKPELCEQVGTEIGWCYHSFATYYAAQISYVQREESCSKAREWESDCSVLIPQYASVADCERSSKKMQCFTSSAVFKEDISICDNLSENERVNCYLQVASFQTEEEAKATCERISRDVSAQIQCMNRINQKKANREEQVNEIIENLE